MYLELRGIRKTFDASVALQDIDLSVGEHEFVCLLGPSGCGKTTLLRIVAGLLPFDRGTITLGGRDLSALRRASAASASCSSRIPCSPT